MPETTPRKAPTTRRAKTSTSKTAAPKPRKPAPPAAEFSDAPTPSTPVRRRPKAATPAAPPVAAGVPEALATVWQAAPPIGGPAATTAQIAATVGVNVWVVLPQLNRLAEIGRAQKLHRVGTIELSWRRQ